MAYADLNTIHNPSTGTAPPASWGDQARDNDDWLSTTAPHARVYNSAAISHTTSGAWQTVTFNSERYDTGGCHSTVTNTGRLTVPSGGGGVYDIGGCIEFANSTGARGIRILLNGVTQIGGNFQSSSGSIVFISCSCKYLLAAGDYVELQGYQGSGGALNMNASGNYSPEFWFDWTKAS